MWYLSLWIWLVLWNLMISGSMHIPADVGSHSWWLIKSPLWKYITFSFFSICWWASGWFCFLVVVLGTAVNTDVQYLCGCWLSLSGIMLSLLRILPMDVCTEFSSLHSLQQCLLFIFLMICLNPVKLCRLELHGLCSRALQCYHWAAPCSLCANSWLSQFYFCFLNLPLKKTTSKCGHNVGTGLFCLSQ